MASTKLIKNNPLQNAKNGLPSGTHADDFNRGLNNKGQMIIPHTSGSGKTFRKQQKGR